MALATMAADRAAAQAGAGPSPQGDVRVNALTGAYNASGQQLFAQLAVKPSNIVFSPYSVGSAMAMALAGARGDTAAEMSKVLMHHLAAGDIDAANLPIASALGGKADLGRKTKMVLPVRIELTTSPFITPTLSRPPRTAFVRWTIPSPWVVSDR